MNNRPVFVYGTLMTGQCADNRLEGAVFAGPARLDGYALYDLGRYPGIVAQPGGTVWGELWYTDDQTVEQMDLYEEEGSLYRRSPVRVLCGGTLREAEAYVYLHEVQGEPWTERVACPLTRTAKRRSPVTGGRRFLLPGRPFLACAFRMAVYNKRELNCRKGAYRERTTSCRTALPDL